jgi:hypothetical protein
MRPWHSASVLLILVSSGLLAACEGVRTEVRGSGTVSSEPRTVSDFDWIEISGPGVITIAQANAESLQIEAEDNILAVLTSAVENGRLKLGHEPFTNIVPTRPITYRITVRDLRGVSVSGSGEATVAIANPDRFEVDISGSGSVTPSGATKRLIVSISGSGRFRGEGFLATAGEASVSGSGEAVVNVSADLTATVSGSGRIVYIGDPVLERSVSGSGSITQR